MKQLVEVIAKALVDNPDEVVVTETQKDKAIIVNLKVASSDIGKVIGKSGRIAKSIRAVVSAAASNTDKKVIVAVSYTHLRAHETCADLVCRLLLEKKK